MTDYSELDLDNFSVDERYILVGKEIKNRIDMAVDAIEGVYRDSLGEEYDSMVHDKQQALVAITATDSVVRRAGLNALLKHHDANQDELFRICTALAQSDDSSEVRADGIGGLWRHCLNESNSTRVLNTLAEFVLNDEEDDSVRMAAYKGLIYSTNKDTDVSVPLLSFPDDIDWDYVRGYSGSRL